VAHGTTGCADPGGRHCRLVDRPGFAGLGGAAGPFAVTVGGLAGGGAGVEAVVDNVECLVDVQGGAGNGRCGGGIRRRTDNGAVTLGACVGVLPGCLADVAGMGGRGRETGCGDTVAGAAVAIAGSAPGKVADVRRSAGQAV